MTSPKDLLDNNRLWSEAMRARDPQFFSRLTRRQAPKYLWIGCSDSRVPATTVIDGSPGDLFVHRNISNVVSADDLNGMSVMQYAVEMLQVEHIVVTGHYGCGGVLAVLEEKRLGLIDGWLRHVGDVMGKHEAALNAIPLSTERHARLCELNVVEQVSNACRTPVVQDAWRRGQPLAVHGWCYGLADGRIRDLGMDVAHAGELMPVYACTLRNLISTPVPT